MKSILNIVVCYNNKNDILQYIEGLTRQRKQSHIWVCIVINDETSEMFFREYSESDMSILVVKAPGNIGYMRGAIYGYEYFIKNYKIDMDWVIVSNADIEYKNNHFFVDLCDMNLSEDIVCIGPDTYVPETGEYQNPALYERIGKNRLLLLIAIFSNSVSGMFYLKMSNFRKKKAPRKKRNSSIVYMVHGSYWILKPEVMDSAVKKPYGALLYSEELYIAELVRELNKKMYYTDKLQVIHNEHVSTRHVKYKQKCRLLAQSYKFIYQTFFR